MYQAVVPKQIIRKDGIPILISKKNTEQYQYARMLHCNQESLYFVSPFDPEIGSELNIIIEFYSHYSSGSGHAYTCRGKVMQTKEVLDGYIFNYGVDVRICNE